MNFNYLTGLYNWKSEKCKILGGFSDEKHAKEYGEFIKQDRMLIGSIVFVADNDENTVFLSDSGKSSAWASFEKAKIYNCDIDIFENLANVAWKSDFKKALKEQEK